MSKLSKRGLLATAAQRASKQPEFMGYLLDLYLHSHGVERAELASMLGTSEEVLMRLSLCLRPRSPGPLFAMDIDRLSARFDLDSDRLAQVVREAEALEALRGITRNPDILLTARDREEPPSPPEGGDGDAPPD